MTIAFNTAWHSAQEGGTGEALALDDRLLFVGPDPAGRSEAAPQHLLLAQRADDGWRVTSLGPVGVPTLLDPLEITAYGLTPDRGAVILSYQNDRREADSHTRIYRVPSGRRRLDSARPGPTRQPDPAAQTER